MDNLGVVLNNSKSPVKSARTSSSNSGSPSKSSLSSSSMRRPSPSPMGPFGSPVSPTHGSGGRPASLMDHNQGQAHVVRVVVNRDERGYGMKVSGDNPVYVQSVKEGGAAERAGLHAGDKIIKVNGINVMQSTHTQVVALIKSQQQGWRPTLSRKASSQVVLTVQQRSVNVKNMGSPSLHSRPSSTSSRITGPQPVDNEKQYQLQVEKEQYYRLMIEKEQNYIDLLRSQIASSPDEKKLLELAKTEKNLQTLQAMLLRNQNEQQYPTTTNTIAVSPDNTTISSPSTSASTPTSAFPSPQKSPHHRAVSPNGNRSPDVPPPLPKRNTPVNKQHPLSYVNGSVVVNNFLNNEINANIASNPRNHHRNNKKHPLPPPLFLNKNNTIGSPGSIPPPLPPRTSHSAPLPEPMDPSPSDAVNSINKQMSYPLVATCATLVNDYSPNPTHHRTKSSPETLLSLSGSEGTKKLSESMNDLTGGPREVWETPPGTPPPGTPPPPYPSPRAIRRELGSPDEGDNTFDEQHLNISGESGGLFRGNSTANNRVLINSSPIHAATPPVTQQPIISMEDDEISDQEISNMEDHGHFKSLSRLWEHLPHLAVFTNYILSNSDPNSLMFYLLTDLYKEGNAKEMRKWAFEIHSCFLVPGAPLRLGNVDENIAREIDEVLTKEYDKEEILRKIFWKARSRAKEELTRQLADFQQKRTAGLGTIFGPTDTALAEIYNDKTKETKLYETLFIEKLDPYLEEIEKENYDSKRYYMAAALTTVLTRIFQIRPSSHAFDRCPIFVNKEKSFRTKFIGKYSRKLNVLGHQFVAQQYYTVIICNNCHQILYGISPQGYQCSACLINLHRHCVKQFEDSCPGPITKKDSNSRGIMKLIGMRHDSNDHNKISRRSNQFLQMERERRQLEDRDNSFDLTETVEAKQGHPVSRTGSDRRPDAVREEGLKHQESTGVSETVFHSDVAHENLTASTPDSSTILPAVGSTKRTASNINRSESVKEQSEKRKQRRNISDPSHNTTSGDVDLERHQTLSNTDSGSSSNSSISCNGRHSESPSNSLDVSQTTIRTNLDSDSDMDVDTELWQTQVVPEELRNLSPHEKKRQDVINELFHTENSHGRNLKVLYKIFYKKVHDSQTLKPDELSLIFPNIKEIFDIHNEINREMKRKRKEDLLVKDIGDLMLKMFDDKQGEALKKAAATFCERQQLALELIKKRRERDSKFDSVLMECEKKRQCRRLPFQGILPTEMQRLSKYPLLLERLIGSIETNKDLDERQQEELLKLKRAHHQCKEILNFVNEAAKLAHNKHRLEEIQKHLDTNSFDGRCDSTGMPEFKMLDVTKYKLIIEGGMQLRKANKAIVPVHILLLEEIVVILQRDGDKFLLKYFQSAQSTPLSPIIKLNTLLVRNNAVCRNALFLVNMSTNTMYDLIADDESKREVWSKHFSDAIESFNRREGKSKLKEPFNDDDSDSERLHDLPPANEVAPERAEAVGGEEQSQQKASTATVSSSSTAKENRTSVAESDSSTATKEDQETQQQEEDDQEGRNKSDVTSDSRDSSAESPKLKLQTPMEDSAQQNTVKLGYNVPAGNLIIGAGGGAESTTKITAEDWPLIQPSQVNVAMPPVHTAESMLTPLEQIKRKDALVKQALEDKEDLVADMLSIPREHFQHIADIMVSADTATRREPSERVLTVMFQVDQLQKAVNQALDISELDQITLKGGKHPSCASQQQESVVDNDQDTLTPVSSSIGANPPLTIQVGVVRDIASSLSSELTTLLSEVRNLEEERERLRKELHKVKEVLHEQNHLHSPIYQNIIDDNITDNVLTSTPSTVECVSEQSSSTPLNDSIQIITKSDCEDEEELLVD